MLTFFIFYFTFNVRRSPFFEDIPYTCLCILSKLNNTPMNCSMLIEAYTDTRYFESLLFTGFTIKSNFYQIPPVFSGPSDFTNSLGTCIYMERILIGHRDLPSTPHNFSLPDRHFIRISKYTSVHSQYNGLHSDAHDSGYSSI